MTVERTQAGHQTRYALRDDNGLSCVLTYGDFDAALAVWKILLPGPGGTEDLYGTHRFPAPSSSLLRAWLASIVGDERANELTDAVDAGPPRTSGWRLRDDDDG
jgi:hypothetical protein